MKKTKVQSPFGPDWKYVTVEMRCRDGVQTQARLWKHRQTGELKWERL